MSEQLGYPDVVSREEWLAARLRLLESERAAIADRIAATQSLLESTRAERDRSTQEWAVLREQLDLRQRLLANLRAERRAAERVLSQRQEGVREADGQLDRLKAEYAEMIRLAAQIGRAHV